jgi:hypothetical protein
MEPQAKKSNGVKSGEGGTQCFGAVLPARVFQKNVIDVVTHLKIIHSFFKFKLQNFQTFVLGMASWLLKRHYYLHYYVQKPVQPLSLLSMNKFIVFL